MNATTIGFRVKSGWAALVLITGELLPPTVLDSCRIELCDPAEPESLQPYHAMEGRTESAGRKESARLVKLVMRQGVDSVTQQIKSYQRKGYRIKKAGIVVGSLIDPSKISNEHIRWHALEGQLFRKVVEEGLRSFRLPFEEIIERSLYESAEKILKQSKNRIQKTLVEIGHEVEGPWRSEQKSACLAAWIANSQS